MLLEDSLTSAEARERAFAHFKLCVVFERIGGFILGKLARFNDQGSAGASFDILLRHGGEQSERDMSVKKQGR
ncbi:MAG: hypothetical protein ACRCVX_14460 [Shewanella sp.]